nr:putative ribonuclease H-like domain-containing protein [Tanacetum cinerariifolium]
MSPQLWYSVLYVEALYTLSLTIMSLITLKEVRKFRLQRPGSPPKSGYTSGSPSGSRQWMLKEKKSQAPEMIMSFIKMVENQNDVKVKQIRIDNGTEFRNHKLESFCDEKGISQNFSSPYTPEQNGVAERKNKTLIEAARTMLNGSDKCSRDQHIELVNIIGNPGKGMLTRSMATKLAAASASECLFSDFLFVIEPKKVSKSLKHPGWIDAMQEELDQFYRNKELEENLVTHFQDFQNTFEPSNDIANVVNAPREPYVFKQDHGSFVDNILFDLNRAPDSPHLHIILPNQFRCFHCKDVLRDGEACKRCTCAKCGNGLGKGLCYSCGNNQNSLNDSPSISETSSQSPPHINHCCYECGDPLDGIFCKRCTCKSCGKDAHIDYNCPTKVLVISNPEPFKDETINELPQTLPSFHPTFHSEAESPFTCDSTPTYVDESPNIFTPPPQPLLYPCEFYGNDAHYGHYCTPQVPFIYLKPCYNQDFNFPQYFQNLPQQYPCCDCGVTHKAYQCQPMNEVYDYGQNSCYDSTSIGFDQSQPQQYTINHPIFNAYNDYLDSQIQLNSTLAKLTERMTSVTSLITPNEPVLSTKEPDNSLSMEDEHLDTILATESDEFIKSSVENLIPILSKSEGIPDHRCDVPFHDNSLPLDVSKDPFEDFSESNEEFSSTDDDSFSFDKIDYVEASPPDSELVSSEVMEIVIPKVGGIDDDILLTMKDDILHENLLNVNHLFAKIEALNDNPIPFYDPIISGTPLTLTLFGESAFFLETKSSSTSFNSLLEKTNNFDNSLPEFTTFSNVLFDAEYESNSSNDQSCSDEDILEKIIDSLLDEFAGELTLLKSISLGIDETDCDFEEDIRLIEKLLYDNSSPRPPEEFASANSDAESKSFSPSPILVKDSDSLMEEIDLFCTPDYLMPPRNEDDDYDSERDILILKDLRSNNTLSFAEKESFHYDIPLFSRPPAKPPDGERKPRKGQNRIKTRQKREAEFWSTVVAFDPFPSVDEPEKHPLKEFLIKFLVLNGQRPLTLDFNTFCSSTGLNYNNGKYVDHPIPEVFGRNYSSTKQVNSIQQLLAYGLITETKVDIREIIYSDLVTKLLNKSRLKYVSYPSFISCALQVLLGSEYTQDKKFGFLPPILSNSNFTKDPSKVTDIKLIADMIDGPEASGSLSKKCKRPKSKKPPIKTMRDIQLFSTGLPSTLDEGTRKSKHLLESTATHPKDLGGNKQPFDRDITSMTPDKGRCPESSSIESLRNNRNNMKKKQSPMLTLRPPLKTTIKTTLLIEIRLTNL